MLLCDAGLAVLAANNAAAELLRCPAGNLAGRNSYDVLPPQPPQVPRVPARWQTRLEWGSAIVRQGGRIRLEVCGSALNDAPAGAQGWVLTLKRLDTAQEAPEFIGTAPATVELLEFVSRIARSRAASILLQGESGTGKELIAKRLHALSPRAGRAFVPINCAALPEHLLESELFGYEKGAFTSAGQTKEGLLEIADGGTVFLDEIGDLSLLLQAKLLRVVEEHAFRRIGGRRNISADLRFVAATNMDLEKAVATQRFRNDLYYRLNGVQIQLPPLRERAEDIQALTIHLLGHFNRVHRRHIRGIHPSAQRLLDTYAWPGNVRELRNVMERAVLVESAPLIMPASVALRHHAASQRLKVVPIESGFRSARFSLHAGERELIAAALGEAHGNQSRAAALLGIGRFSLRYKMKKLGLL